MNPHNESLQLVQEELQVTRGVAETLSACYALEKPPTKCDLRHWVNINSSININSAIPMSSGKNVSPNRVAKRRQKNRAARKARKAKTNK